jgi:H+/Cl- antiporter ClcA
LAAIGFVAVFAGATHTPIASALMGMELFGFSMALWVLLTCYVAYFCSGTKGIYNAQELNIGKKWLYQKLRWF